jgi:hypothetical protein
MVDHLKTFWFVYIIGAALVAALVMAVKFDAQERAEWNEFAKDHDCKAVEFKKGTTSTGYAVSGKGTISTIVSSEPDQTCWACNDGKRYWRSN